MRNIQLHVRTFFTNLSASSIVFSSIFLIVDDLKVVYGQKRKGLGEFVHYYGLAVVQKGTSFNFKQLKGKNSCHTGVGRTVGWKIPVGYLLYNKNMTFTDNQYKSAADYFGESCAPGKFIRTERF